MSNIPLIMFLVFIAITLGITYWASRRSAGASAYFAASRQIKGWQNGIAVAGDYMSAASFLGIAGIIAFQGYDGFMFSVGWLVAYLTVLLVIAEPLRNAGKYTMADVLAYRLKPRPVRAMASLSTLTVSTFYMIAQMVGAGALVKLLLGGTVSYNKAVIGVGILMIVYVVFGGMLATTWVQIIKAILLMAGTLLLSILVMAHFHFSFGEFFGAIAHVSYTDAKGATVVKDFLQPGLRLQAAIRAAGFDLAGTGIDFWHGWVAAHPGAVLYGAGCEDGAPQRGVGDGTDWQLLHHDDVPGIRSGDDCGSGLHQEARRNEHECAVAGASTGGIGLLCIHFGDCVCHDSGGGGGTDDQCDDLVFARLLDQRDSSRSGAEAGRGSDGGAHFGVRDRGGSDCDRHRAGTDGECGVPGGAGVCSGGVGESAGDCDVDFLAAV